jgi:poly(A) polymerase
MQPNGHLAVQPWMTDPRTERVLGALRHAGIEARFVGGCVRDALRGQVVGDVDLAIDRPPGDAARALEAAHIKVIPTGIKHGTITAVSGGRPFEITTLRRDIETDGRRAVVAFTDDWRADAARRDFTINAMFCDASGALWDFFGGRDDLAAGRATRRSASPRTCCASCGSSVSMPGLAIRRSTPAASPPAVLPPACCAISRPSACARSC